jgi:hypothetical protein
MSTRNLAEVKMGGRMVGRAIRFNLGPQGWTWYAQRLEPGTEPCPIFVTLGTFGMGTSREARRKAINEVRRSALGAAAPMLISAIERLLVDSCYLITADSCECGRNGDGVTEDGKPCAHVEALRLIDSIKFDS